MKNVRVDREKLLQILHMNLAEHRDLFEKALVGYRALAIKELDAMLTEAKAGKRIRRAVALNEPIDQTKEYDRAIRMVEMSVDATIELSETDFQYYVLDDWGWKVQVTMTNSSYTKS